MNDTNTLSPIDRIEFDSDFDEAMADFTACQVVDLDLALNKDFKDLNAQ